MSSYQETLDYLYDRLPMFTRIGAAAFKKDLTNTLKLCRFLGDPQKKFPSVHIAGTNGKGSTSHMLASVFQENGYKTGLYTSPHLRDFRERIRINGEMIPEEEVVSFTDSLKDIIEETEPSFFELTVAMAFRHFALHKVDIAIIETGMGGRLDSTNVITPLLSVITNIGFDHMDFLGNTLPEIAGEKAGIIKTGVPVVIGETHDETKDVFTRKAAEKNAAITFADQVRKAVFVKRQHQSQVFEVVEEGRDKGAFTLDLLGNYQQKNLLTVLESVRKLREHTAFVLDEAQTKKALSKVMANTGLAGRWHMLGEKPYIFCDTGHNKDGIRYVLEMIASYSFAHLHMVIGMVKDKQVEDILELLPKNAIYYFTQAKIPRAMEAAILAEKALKAGLKGQVVPDVKEALATAEQNASPADFIFVGGSTFVVAEIV